MISATLGKLVELAILLKNEILYKDQLYNVHAAKLAAA